MSPKTAIRKPEGLYKASFRGIKAVGDMALWKKPAYSDQATLVLLSLYGSENQLRGLFSALATNNVITLDDLELSRGFEGHLRFKSWRIGYGKYHALVWNETLATDCIIAAGSETDAWERFMLKRKVPFLKEWIPQIKVLLEREGLVETLEGIRLKGWHWTTTDDEACDKITAEINL